MAALLGPGRLTRAAFNDASKISEGTVRKRFGGWQAALDRAGLGDKFSRPGTDASVEDVIADLQRIAKLVSPRPMTFADLRRHGRAATDRSVRRHFRYFPKALEAAGLEGAAHGRRWTEDDYHDNLLEVWTHYGRAPSKGEIDRPPSKITASAYARKFGTWVRAKQAFVDRVNADVDAAQQETFAVPRTRSTSSVAKPQPEDLRPIPVGLRYQVLRRDNFKCVLCGRSPATDPAIVLHVDHILAFSRGGKTRLDNLRSTCQDCNLGKGAGD